MSDIYNYIMKLWSELLIKITPLAIEIYQQRQTSEKTKIFFFGIGAVQTQSFLVLFVLPKRLAMNSLVNLGSSLGLSHGAYLKHPPAPFLLSKLWRLLDSYAFFRH